jgi:ribosomal protein S18 acetylase RimI-like enzyme
MLALLPRTYAFTVTDELDADYLKYLRRKLSSLRLPESATPSRDAHRLDISYDDPDGDVVAGLAAWTEGDTLTIDMLWVDTDLRGQGIGRALLHMAEEIALARGCKVACVGFAPHEGFYQKLGYTVSARLVQYPTGQAFAQMHKPLVNDLTQFPKIAL